MVELLAEYIAGDVQSNDSARLVLALNAGANAAGRIEGWLTSWADGRGDVEAVAAGCCGTGAGSTGEVPQPGCAFRGDGGCRCAGGEESEGGDLVEHDDCLKAD